MINIKLCLFQRWHYRNTGHNISKLYKNEKKKKITIYLHEATEDWTGKYVIFPPYGQWQEIDFGPESDHIIASISFNTQSHPSQTSSTTETIKSRRLLYVQSLIGQLPAYRNTEIFRFSVHFTISHFTIFLHNHEVIQPLVHSSANIAFYNYINTSSQLNSQSECWTQYSLEHYF